MSVSATKDMFTTTKRSALAWVEPVARIGFLTKGIVYALVGGLAVKAAMGSGGKVDGSKGAVETIGSQPFGQFLLVVTAIGLFAYAAWRFVQAALDLDNEGKAGFAVLKRVGFVVSGLLHAFLGVTAVQMMMGSGSGSSKKTWISQIMALDGIGPVLVGIAGILVFVFAGYQLYKGATMEFKEKLATGSMSQTEEKTVTVLGRVGLIARGGVFGIVGYYLLQAAWSQNSTQAKTLGDALSKLAQQPYGAAILGTVAAGLVAYGVLQVAYARYRKVPSPA